MNERSDLPIKERAGTLLDHRFTRPIFQTRHGKKVDCGRLDTRQRVYQCGGEIGKQVYWKLGKLGVGLEEWAQIRDAADWYEFVDLKTNYCYRISMADAIRLGDEYDGERGRRYGIPYDAFTRYSGPGLGELAPPKKKTHMTRIEWPRNSGRFAEYDDDEIRQIRELLAVGAGHEVELLHAFKVEFPDMRFREMAPSDASSSMRQSFPVDTTGHS